MAEDSVTSFNKNARLDALHDFIEQHGFLVNVSYIFRLYLEL